MTRFEEAYNDGNAVAKLEASARLKNLLNKFEYKDILPFQLTVEYVSDELKRLEKEFATLSIGSIKRGEDTPRSEFDYGWTHTSGYEGGMLMASLDLGCLLNSIETKSLTLDQIEKKIESLKESYDDEV